VQGFGVVEVVEVEKEEIPVGMAVLTEVGVLRMVEREEEEDSSALVFSD
jgi:hypothetical protein